jgi:hypothetical protein
MLAKDCRVLAMKWVVVLKLLVTRIFVYLLPYIASNRLHFSLTKFAMEPGMVMQSFQVRFADELLCAQIHEMTWVPDNKRKFILDTNSGKNFGSARLRTVHLQLCWHKIFCLL